MAHVTRESGHRAAQYVSSTSRYKSSDIIYYSENNLLTFKIYKKRPMQFGTSDKWFEITPDVEYRPDLVSFDFYGVPDFWWKIMEMNRMKDILEFRAGRNIRLPGSIL